MARYFSAIFLIGMSGVGKSHWADIYAEGGIIVSADERIADQIFPEVRFSNWAEKKEKLDQVASYVGKFGAEGCGELAREKFFKRQEIYSKAERDSLSSWLYDLPNWLGWNGEDDVSLYDTTGSFCEVVDKGDALYGKIVKYAVIVYLECSEAEEEILLRRQLERPKPMVYNRIIFEEWLSDYKKEKSIEEEDIDPDDFLRFIFPKAIEYRRARYEALADVVVSPAELEALPRGNSSPSRMFAKAFVSLVQDKLRQSA